MVIECTQMEREKRNWITGLLVWLIRWLFVWLFSGNWGHLIFSQEIGFFFFLCLCVSITMMRFPNKEIVKSVGKANKILPIWKERLVKNK